MYNRVQLATARTPVRELVVNIFMMHTDTCNNTCCHRGAAAVVFQSKAQRKKPTYQVPGTAIQSTHLVQSARYLVSDKYVRPTSTWYCWLLVPCMGYVQYEYVRRSTPTYTMTENLSWRMATNFVIVFHRKLGILPYPCRGCFYSFNQIATQSYARYPRNRFIPPLPSAAEASRRKRSKA